MKLSEIIPHNAPMDIYNMPWFNDGHVNEMLEKLPHVTDYHSLSSWYLNSIQIVPSWFYFLKNKKLLTALVQSCPNIFAPNALYESRNYQGFLFSC